MHFLQLAVVAGFLANPVTSTLAHAKKLSQVEAAQQQARDNAAELAAAVSDSAAGSSALAPSNVETVTLLINGTNTANISIISTITILDTPGNATANATIAATSLPTTTPAIPPPPALFARANVAGTDALSTDVPVDDGTVTTTVGVVINATVTLNVSSAAITAVATTPVASTPLANQARQNFPGFPDISIPFVSIPGVSLPTIFPSSCIPVPCITAGNVSVNGTATSINVSVGITAPTITASASVLVRERRQDFPFGGLPPGISIPDVGSLTLCAPTFCAASANVTIGGTTTSLNISTPIITPTLPPTTVPAIPVRRHDALPPISIPKISIPHISVPTISIPHLTLPNITAPTWCMPASCLPSGNVTLNGTTILNISTPLTTPTTLPPVKARGQGIVPPISVPGVSIPKVCMPTLCVPATNVTVNGTTPLKVSTPSITLSTPSVTLPTTLSTVTGKMRLTGQED